MAFHVGNCSHESAQQLLANLAAMYGEQATFFTDQYVVYTGSIPVAQHRAITKHSRKTNHIERFHNTLRQRVSRLVRGTLIFAKNSLIWYHRTLHTPLQPNHSKSTPYARNVCKTSM